MATQTERIPLSRDRVLAAAVELADREGIHSLTMRNLASALGVEAMSLYYHVANKEDLLDGMVDAIAAEMNAEVARVPAPSDPGEWKAATRARILAARRVMLRHPWAPGVLETRSNMSAPMLRYFDDFAGLFRKNGFSLDLTHHAMHALGSRAIGFTQELFGEDQDQEMDPEVAATMMGEMAAQFPYVTEFVTQITHDDPDSTLGWCDDQTEFEFGLDLLLDGLERLRDNG